MTVGVSDGSDAKVLLLVDEPDGDSWLGEGMVATWSGRDN